MYIGKISILQKSNIFDPQGETTKKSLERLSVKDIEDVRIGRYIEMKINVESEEEAKRKLEKAIKELLVNPIIESYTYKIEEM